MKYQQFFLRIGKAGFFQKSPKNQAGDKTWHIRGLAVYWEQSLRGL